MGDGGRHTGSPSSPKNIDASSGDMVKSSTLSSLELFCAEEADDAP